MPKEYGTPTGYQEPSQTRKQKAATPGDASAYLKHMLEADKAYHAQAKGAQQQQAPRGSSSYDAQGRYKMPKGLRGKQIDAEVKKGGG